ncbi:hypothetical protein GCM10009654_39230 [Streptomyces hebeiensis]|uniref:Clp R domain-containing protein n=1 Tax=Streptomyces hebeiensis TaxID=229486 RepID=A0ABP4FME7_9ACTN
MMDTDAPETPVLATEFEDDVIALLAETLRRAVKRERRTVGTEDLLSELVMGDSEAGEALTPGMRAAGALSGLIAGRSDAPWAHDDEGNPDGPAAEPSDEAEAVAVWREARWRVAHGGRGLSPAEDGAWPEPTGALRQSLLRALALARREGTPSVRCRHVARALVETAGTRAAEALALRRISTATASAALDALDARVADEPAPPSRALALLVHAGTLGKEGRSGWLMRAVLSWTAGMDGTVLTAVSLEARRRAVRCGRAAAEPVDLLLALPALDRALSVAGRSLPADVASAHDAARLLGAYGARPDSLARRTVMATAAFGPVPADSERPVSPHTEQIVARGRLLAAEQGDDSSFGTVHVLAALLDDEGGEAAALLREEGVDVAALRERLPRRPGA